LASRELNNKQQKQRCGGRPLVSPRPRDFNKKSLKSKNYFLQKVRETIFRYFDHGKKCRNFGIFWLFQKSFRFL